MENVLTPTTFVFGARERVRSMGRGWIKVVEVKTMLDMQMALMYIIAAMIIVGFIVVYGYPTLLNLLHGIVPSWPWVN